MKDSNSVAHYDSMTVDDFESMLVDDCTVSVSYMQIRSCVNDVYFVRELCDLYDEDMTENDRYTVAHFIARSEAYCTSVDDKRYATVAEACAACYALFCEIELA